MNRFLDAFSHLYKRVCLSVGPSVRPSVRPSVHTRVEFLWNEIFGLNVNKIVLGTWNYAIRKTIQIQIHKQIALTHLMPELCHICILDKGFLNASLRLKQDRKWCNIAMLALRAHVSILMPSCQEGFLFGRYLPTMTVTHIVKSEQKLRSSYIVKNR